MASGHMAGVDDSSRQRARQGLAVPGHSRRLEEQLSCLVWPAQESDFVPRNVEQRLVHRFMPGLGPKWLVLFWFYSQVGWELSRSDLYDLHPPKKVGLI